MMTEFIGLNKRFDELASNVKEIYAAVKGDPSLGQIGIVPRLEAIEDTIVRVDFKTATGDLEKLKIRVDELGRSQTVSERKAAFELGKHAGISFMVSLLVALIAALIAKGH